MQQQAMGNDADSPVLDEDWRVIARLAAGDRDALADLYAGYRVSLLTYLRALLRDTDLAEEVFQDTLVAAWLGAARYERRATVGVWLIGIARRRAFETLRRRAVPTIDDTAIAAMPTSDPDPESIAIVAAERDTLHAAMDRLSPLHREVLVLNFMHELPYRDIATILDLPMGTVMSRLHHAKRALRAELMRGRHP